jgi:hypothetical protein
MIEILEHNPKGGMVCGKRFNGHVGQKSPLGPLYVGNKTSIKQLTASSTAYPYTTP